MRLIACLLRLCRPDRSPYTRLWCLPLARVPPTLITGFLLHPLPPAPWCLALAHASVPPTSLQARRSGFVLMKLYINTESCRAPLLGLIVTPSPWPLNPLVPIFIFTTSPASSASLPRLDSVSRSCCPHPAHACTAHACTGTPRVASSACHARPARGVRCFLSGGIDCHGVLRP